MSRARKTQAEVKTIKQFGSDVFLVDLKVEVKYTRFEPGQFLHLTLDDFDPVGGYWPESRVFSICSGPGEEVIRIVYSVKGRYTKRMQEEIEIGRTFWLKMPFGSFTMDMSLLRERSIVLVAGGTGVSPFISYLNQISKNGHFCDVTLFYGVKEPSLMVFRDELARIQKNLHELKIEVYSEEATGDERFHHGILDISEIHSRVTSLADPVYFLSGPPVMISDFRRYLLDAGVPPADIRIDEWE